MKKIKNFTDLNKPKSCKCVIVGSAPSLSNFNYKKFSGKIFAIGDAAIRGKTHFRPDYWVSCNGLFPVPGLKIHTKILNIFKKTIFIYSKIQIKSQEFKKFFKENLKIKLFEYDNIHQSFTPCSEKNICCEYINYKSDNTINGNLKKILNYQGKFSFGGSVFVQALAIAMIMGFKNIYITGVDLPEKKKYYKYYDCLEADELIYKTFNVYNEIIIKNNNSFYFKSKYFFKKHFNKIYIALTNFFKPNTDFYNNSQLYKSLRILSKLAKRNKIFIKCDSDNKRLKSLLN
jgi:hypothetical protein